MSENPDMGHPKFIGQTRATRQALFSLDLLCIKI
jgi:hypothetical protein